MKFKYTITGIDCPNCAAKLASMIEAKEGIDTARINFLAERLTVESSLAEEELLATVRRTAKAFSSDIEVE
ncbi:MAG: cation transporter [Clostridia bacterium]|nr:cation transporter [Clostridia bacterium]MBQ8371776.1 cation transporter [Clostridia bacterium]